VSAISWRLTGCVLAFFLAAAVAFFAGSSGSDQPAMRILRPAPLPSMHYYAHKREEPAPENQSSPEKTEPLPMPEREPEVAPKGEGEGTTPSKQPTKPPLQQ